MLKGKAENKDKQEQAQEGKPKGILDGKGGSAKEKVDNTKQKVQKIKKIIDFFKRHPLLAKIAFWVILAIIVIILFTMIIYAIVGAGEQDATVALDTTIENMQRISGGISGEDDDETENSTRKTTAGTIVEDNGKYYYELLYGDDSEEKNKERVNTIKEKLKKRDIEIYDNQCLLFLAVMVENGLDISLYNKNDLEAMYMFIKAEIATSSLDLGAGETLENQIVPSGLTYSKSDYDENDYSNDRISGTIKVQRVTYNGNGATNKQLTYINLESFENLMESNNETANDYFTLDEENNLVVAGWRNTTIEYEVSSYQIDGTENEEQKTTLQNYYDSSDEIQRGTGLSVYKYKSIPYLNYVSKYTMPFNFLMALLANTDDADFCKEMAKIAEKSSMTITLHEEYSGTTTTGTTTHEEIEKVYATIDANVAGDVTTTTTGDLTTVDISSYSTVDAVLSAFGGTGTTRTQVYSGVWEYVWVNGSTEYRLIESDRMILYSRTTTTETKTETGNIENNFVTKALKIQSSKPTELNNFGGFNDETALNYTDRFKALADYTTTRNSKYTLVTTTTNEFNSYSMEVTEVDNWYEYYQKTYSEVGTKDLSRPDTEGSQDLEPQIYSNEITDSESINNIEYIKGISDDEKNRVIGETIGTTDFSNPKFEITKVTEDIYYYGTETTKTHHVGTKYKRAGTEKELVQVKVQKDNETALLSIAADAFGAQNKNEEENSSQEEEMQKEEIYQTTDEKENSFLYVYDKYDGVQNTFSDIDEWIYEMFNKRKSCTGMTNLMKYLIFLYDGTDLGVTEYDLTLLQPSEFKNGNKINNALAEVLKSYENNALRLYMNGELYDYSSVQNYVTQDKTKYKLYYTSFDGCLNFSYGIMVRSKNGNLNNTEYFENEGIDLKLLINQYDSGQDVYVDVEIIDRIYLNIIKDKKDSISAIFEKEGINIKSYELDALVNVAYQYGNCGQYLSGDNKITQIYKKYILDPEEPDYEGFFNNAKCQVSGGTARFFITGNYAIREENNRILFQEGRYLLSTGEEISNGATVAEFALQFVDENHERFTSYDPTNGVEDIWYGADWCAMFVSYCYNECGLIPSVLKKPFACCDPSYADAEDIFIWKDSQSEYEPESGDIIFFWNDNRSGGSHVGIVCDCDGTTVYTVEGNTRLTNGWQTSKVSKNVYPITASTIMGYIPINH